MEGLREVAGVSGEEMTRMALAASQYWREGQRVAAVKIYRALVLLDPRYYIGHAGLGLAEMAEGEYAAAEVHLQTAARLAPDDWNVQVNLGETLVHLEKGAEALTVLKRVVVEGEGPGQARARAIFEALSDAVKEMGTTE